MSPTTNLAGMEASQGPPGSIDLKHWEDGCFLADSYADYGRWLELWVDTARAVEGEQGAAAAAKWTERTWPQVKLMTQYMLGLRASTNTTGIAKGLIYGSAEHDTCQFEGHWFSISAWTWRGFVQLQRFLTDTAAVSEPTLAAHLLTESASFKADLDAALQATVVTDPETDEPFFVPPRAVANFTAYPSMTSGGDSIQGFGGGPSYSNFRYYSEMLSAQFMGAGTDVALQRFRESRGGTLSGTASRGR